jgi:hypothetical protein
MNTLKTFAALGLAALLWTGTALGFDHSRQGKILSIDPDAKVMVIQSDAGDQWEIYWTETTKIEDGLIVSELRVGDKVDVDLVEKDGRLFAEQIEREGKAEKR